MAFITFCKFYIFFRDHPLCLTSTIRLGLTYVIVEISIGLWGISPLYIGYGTNEWLRFGVGFFLSYIPTGVLGMDHSLPLKIKKRRDVKHVCVWWVVGMVVVCVPTIYHRHTSTPHTYYYNYTMPLPYVRYYHIRLTDTLSVSLISCLLDNSNCY